MSILPSSPFSQSSRDGEFQVVMRGPGAQSCEEAVTHRDGAGTANSKKRNRDVLSPEPLALQTSVTLTKRR